MEFIVSDNIEINKWMNINLWNMRNIYNEWINKW